jgi:KipI family sensor histidine kinase inhibitor
MKPRLVALSDSALLIQLGDEINPLLNRRVHALDARLRGQQLPGVIETVPAYASLVVHYDPLVLTHAQTTEWVQAALAGAETAAASKPRRIEVPVQYGGAAGPDLASVAGHHGLKPRDVIRIHAKGDYVVYMMGFTPGFPYMGKVARAIATPRLETPRTHVPAGSVGIAGEQTGIYPIDSPGGWRLIGRTSLQLFNLNQIPPFLFSPGDAVRFVVESLDA